MPRDVCEGAEIDIKYSGYLARQSQQIERIKRHEHRSLQQNINYQAITTLSKEAREKLTQIQPTTLGQAARIPGVSQADTAALLLWMELDHRGHSSKSKTGDTLNSPVEASPSEQAGGHKHPQTAIPSTEACFEIAPILGAQSRPGAQQDL
jgi:tRNA uridine 5-carboxymethylaminomethyl modification enzyme